MKFTSALSIVALAAVAVAMPAEMISRGEIESEHEHEHKKGGERKEGKEGTCNNNTTQVCCNGLLNCVVQVLGNNCKSEAYCCNTGAPIGSVINIQALNCVSVL